MSETRGGLVVRREAIRSGESSATERLSYPPFGGDTHVFTMMPRSVLSWRSSRGDLVGR